MNFYLVDYVMFSFKMNSIFLSFFILAFPEWHQLSAFCFLYFILISQFTYSYHLWYHRLYFILSCLKNELSIIVAWCSFHISIFFYKVLWMLKTLYKLNHWPFMFCSLFEMLDFINFLLLYYLNFYFFSFLFSYMKFSILLSILFVWMLITLHLKTKDIR